MHCPVAKPLRTLRSIAYVMSANDGLLAFVHEFMDELTDLKTAVKSKINSLSMLAAEEAAATPAAASAVAAAIEKRINTVSTPLRSTRALCTSTTPALTHVPALPFSVDLWQNALLVCLRGQRKAVDMPHLPTGSF